MRSPSRIGIVVGEFEARENEQAVARKRPFALNLDLRQVSIEVLLVHKGRVLATSRPPGIVATDYVIADAENIEAVNAIEIDEFS